MISRTRAAVAVAAAAALAAAVVVEVGAAHRSREWPLQATATGPLADSSLAFLAPLVGSWRPLDVPAGIDPNVVAHAYGWTVGCKAMELLEGFPLGSPEAAELHGLIYWNPATERVEFVAVAGRGDGQGRLFIGQYRGLGDGSIEREYDVFYRTLQDTPAEELGGSRRRYREVYRLVTPDSIASMLHWFRGGAWRPFGRFASGGFERLSGTESDESALRDHPQELGRTPPCG